MCTVGASAKVTRFFAGAVGPLPVELEAVALAPGEPVPVPAIAGMGISIPPNKERINAKTVLSLLSGAVLKGGSVSVLAGCKGGWAKGSSFLMSAKVAALLLPVNSAGGSLVKESREVSAFERERPLCDEVASFPVPFSSCFGEWGALGIPKTPDGFMGGKPAIINSFPLCTSIRSTCSMLVKKG